MDFKALQEAELLGTTAPNDPENADQALQPLRTPATRRNREVTLRHKRAKNFRSHYAKRAIKREPGTESPMKGATCETDRQPACSTRSLLAASRLRGS